MLWGGSCTAGWAVGSWSSGKAPRRKPQPITWGIRSGLEQTKKHAQVWCIRAQWVWFYTKGNTGTSFVMEFCLFHQKLNQCTGTMLQPPSPSLPAQMSGTETLNLTPKDGFPSRGETWWTNLIHGSCPTEILWGCRVDGVRVFSPALLCWRFALCRSKTSYYVSANADPAVEVGTGLWSSLLHLWMVTST